MRKLDNSQYNSGFTLVELTLVLFITMVLGVLAFQSMKREQETLQARAVGEHIRQVSAATNQYIVLRYAQISNMTNSPGGADPGPRTCVAATNTCTITTATLVNEGMLQPTFSGTNPFGSTYTIRLRGLELPQIII